MAAEPRRGLFDLVVDELERGGVPFALIGAAAMALHGISRSTLDIDLLVTDPGVLDAAYWSGLPEGVETDIRPGDAGDPLAGVIRFRAAGARDVDVVVGRGGWDTGVLMRAEHARYQGRDVPTARIPDLILLKLYAGGRQDRWDIEQLLARPDRDSVIEAVEQLLPALPPEAQGLWRALG